MPNQTTKIVDLINPQVMADMISAKVENKIVVSPFATLDTTLQGQAGDTITVPQYGYIGDAEDIAEGIACGTVKLTTTSTSAKVKKAMKAVEITDEALLSGYGNPIGETNNQLAKSIASKVDNDAMDALQTAQLTYDGIGSVVGYDGVVSAIDVFDEEINTPKVMFINPAQVGSLRKDTNFLAADKLAESLIVSGAIGKIVNTEVVPSKKVPLNSAKTGYICPIIKLEQDNESEEETAALTIYLKRDTNVETERDTLARKTDVSVDKMYTAVLSNASKVVLATFKK